MGFHNTNRFAIWRNEKVPFPVLTVAEVMSRSQDPNAHLPSLAASKKARKGIFDRARRLLKHKPQPPSDAFRPASDDDVDDSAEPAYIRAKPFEPTGDWHFSFSTLGRFFSSKERVGTALGIPFRKYVIDVL